MGQVFSCKMLILLGHGEYLFRFGNWLFSLNTKVRKINISFSEELLPDGTAQNLSYKGRHGVADLPLYFSPGTSNYEFFLETSELRPFLARKAFGFSKELVQSLNLAT